MATDNGDDSIGHGTALNQLCTIQRALETGSRGLNVAT
jgi:hypothetical protein